ncbi:MAG: Unknown protein [uncultured Thiotrichaceae bacterium]|uniref:CheW-like domain-containing protein n=1 Tax=uncultured Thiotrichaceae bacterium TaxID=298394 RepID=A0A6S6U7A7_9GAMM|nr:MAG: Unknown protein [uncultured Thiotrichaceae bacterium]
MNSPYELLAGLALLREKKRQAEQLGDSKLKSWSALVVRVGSKSCVVAQNDIEEILTQDKLTQVKGVAAWFVGVGFFQGKLLNVIDGQYVFDNNSQQHKALLSAVRVLVIPGDKEWFGLKVDELIGMRHVWSDYTDSPVLAAGDTRIAYVNQWVEIEGQKLPILNVKEMVRVLEHTGMPEIA